MTQTPNPPAGWYPDPHQPGSRRYWDGANWTERVEGSAPAKVRATKHKLGMGHGTIVDNGDGTMGWWCKSPLAAFKLRIADVSGFSEGRNEKNNLQRTFNIFGNGTILASVQVLSGTPEKIEAWLRAHPDFGTSAASTAPASPSTPNSLDLADQLAKLAALRDQGILSEAEFAASKARLLG